MKCAGWTPSDSVERDIRQAVRQAKARVTTTKNLSATTSDVLYVVPADAPDGGAIMRALVEFVQTLLKARHSGGCKARLWILTQRAHDVGEADARGGGAQNRLLQSLAWGVGKVVALEHPALACSLVDIADAGGAEVSALVQELLAGSTAENQIRLRGAERLVCRVERGAFKPTEKVGEGELLRLVSSSKGQIDNLHFVRQPRPQVAPDDVEVRIAATGTNFRDVLDALGMYPGKNEFYGLEGAGVVESVGADVQGFEVGDAVFGLIPDSFSSLAVTKASLLQVKPPTLSYEQAATVPVVFLTAYHALHNVANLKRGEKVLVHAASGGVGMAATQLALRLGCEVFGTCAKHKQAYVKSLGVHHTLNSRSTDFAADIARLTNGRGVDVVLNSLSGLDADGNEFIAKSLSTLKKGGGARFVEIGKKDVWSAEKVKATRADIKFEIFDLLELTETQPAKVLPWVHGFKLKWVYVLIIF